MAETTVGLALLIIAGAMNGSFTLPMKFTRSWAWENTWLTWTIFGLFVFPVVVTWLTLPGFSHVYSRENMQLVFVVAAFGAGWGISQVFFGLAVEAIGIALSFSFILGLAAAVGSLIPLIRLHPDLLLKPTGIGIFCGIALVLAGVGVCAVAGREREAILGSGHQGRPSLGKGLLFATISGLGSALVNFGLAFGGPLLDAAQRHGAEKAWTPNADWLPFMIAGGVPNLVYCAYLLGKNRNWNRFRASATSHYWLLGALMAFFWFASTLLYGIAAGKLGHLGVVLGWPAFMSMIVITATVWGLLTGEWKGTGKKPLRIMAAGVAILVLAIFVLGAVSKNLGG